MSLEIVMPGIRNGEAILANSTAVPKGRLGYISGVNAAGKKLIRVPNSSAGAKLAHFPITKLNYQIDESDATLDTIAAGAGIIFYSGEGEYITDQIADTSAGRAMYHRKDVIYGLAIVASTGSPGGKYALLGCTGAGFANTAHSSANPGAASYIVGYAVEYVPIGSSVAGTGYLRFRTINPSATKVAQTVSTARTS